MESHEECLFRQVKQFRNNYCGWKYLVQNNRVISDDQKMADIFLEYFATIVPKLGLAIPKDVIVATNCIKSLVLKAVHKYHRHLSMPAIKEK